MLANSLQKRLEQISERHEELRALLSDAEVIQHQERFRDYSKEFAQNTEIVDCFANYQQLLHAIEATKELLTEQDAEIQLLAQEELSTHQQELSAVTEQLQILLLPVDPNDKNNVFLEIRAAAGGDEAGIFTGDLFRMYCRYAEKQRWQVEILHANASEKGGYKEVIARISGQGVYSQLKYESGAHRVQRVPETEAQGRVHTSTCTVAILPEIAAIEEVNINPNDLKVDTYRASGAGGQHVNKTDSAIRITHIPSGIVVECQDERSQHKNRARAMSLLSAKLLNQEQTKQQNEQAQHRRSLVGTGDRSERIRTYNFPQGRLTDHRINLTLYQLDDIVNGELELVIEPLVREQHALQLAELTNTTSS